MDQGRTEAVVGHWRLRSGRGQWRVPGTADIVGHAAQAATAVAAWGWRLLQCHGEHHGP